MADEAPRSGRRTSRQSGQRTTIIGGAVVLQIILLAAAFFLGVYFERYGLIGGGQGRGPSAPPPSDLEDDLPPGVNPDDDQELHLPGGPLGPPSPLPPCLDEPPQSVGTLIQVLDDGTLELRVSAGTMVVVINQNTAVLGCDLTPISVEDLEANDLLGVYGTFGEDGLTLTATQIILIE